MVDLHCHILPGVDDGADSLEESLAMARLAVGQRRACHCGHPPLRPGERL